MKSALIYLLIAVTALFLLKMRHQDVKPEDLKHSFLDICKENDSAECTTAVNVQFDNCFKQYEEEWDLFMNSKNADFDKAATDFANKVSACIVDENGDQFFGYD